MGSVNGSSTAQLPGHIRGKGVDRLQRLADTNYVETQFNELGARTVIDLTKLGFDPSSSDLIRQHFIPLAGATVVTSVDLPHLYNRTFSSNSPAAPQYADDSPAVAPLRTDDPAKEGLSTGLFVMEKGPFLRGKTVSGQGVEMVDSKQQRMLQPRNLGDIVAFDALFAKLKTEGLFDWVPDGMILSKLESPSGEPLGSAELDARQAQLFNVAVQGPALAKTWTGDAKQAVLPMDKVFVVIVADVVTKTDNSERLGAGNVEATTKVWDAWKAWAEKNESLYKSYSDPKPPEGASSETTTLAQAIQNANVRAANTDTEVDNYAGLVTAEEKNAYFETWDESAWENEAAKLRQAKLGVKKSIMTNFRLKRMTSSYMMEYSNGRGGDRRCGLRIGSKSTNLVAAEYIIGGWCIGSVLDSAASRSKVGNQVKTAPASMALNINVNVEFWSGDELYRHFMDVDGNVERRGVRKFGDAYPSPTEPNKKEKRV
jgi:hypothetical protein